MMLYSFMGARPTPLPFRIHIGGTTRTDPATFTEDEITAAGFIGPYTEPTYDSTTQQLNWADGAYTITALPPLSPQPRWVQFAQALATSAEVNQWYFGLFAPQTSVLHGMVNVGLGQAAQGDSTTFLAAWRQAMAAGLVSPEMAAQMQALAAGFDLPAEFAERLN
jgi:hypothetical protein